MLHHFIDPSLSPVQRFSTLANSHFSPRSISVLIYSSRGEGASDSPRRDQDAADVNRSPEGDRLSPAARRRLRSGSRKSVANAFATTGDRTGRKNERKQRSQEGRPTPESRMEDDDSPGIPRALGRRHGHHRREGRSREAAPGTEDPRRAEPGRSREDRPIESAARREDGSGRQDRFHRPSREGTREDRGFGPGNRPVAREDRALERKAERDASPGPRLTSRAQRTSFPGALPRSRGVTRLQRPPEP